MKVLRWFALTLVGLVLLLAALGGVLWIYSGSDTSLASAVRALTPLLPAGQQLELQDVRGSIRQGGHIGTLRWQQDGLQVQAQDVTLRWQLGALLQREIRLSELSVEQLRIDDQRPPVASAPPEPPGQLGLPIKVDARVRVGLLELTGSTAQRVEQIAFHYTFDSYLHRLDGGQGRFSSNDYSYSGSLQASGPLTLALQANALVNTPVPGSKKTLSVAAHASLNGNLAGRDAKLALSAELIPQDNATATSRAKPREPAKGMRARLSAQLQPWQSQPIVAAHARWQALNLASLWSTAPHTQLSGDATVTPAGAAWQASVQLNNALSGPWDKQRLPIESLQAKLDFTDGRWLLHQLQARAAGGSVSASAQLSISAAWTLRGLLQNIDPAAIDTRLGGDPLSGELSAQQTPAKGATTGTLAKSVAGAPISFTLDLQAKPRDARAPARDNPALQALQALRLQRVTTQGQWSKPTLSLSALQIDAQDVRLQGALSVNSVSLATQGQIDLTVPGLQAAVQGKLSRSDGQGTLSVKLNDATQASQWLARWPQIARTLGQQRWAGQADLSAQWRGGWQNQARDLRLQAQLRSPRLHWADGSADSKDSDVALRDLQLDLSGSMTRFSVGSRGQLATRGHQLDWQTRLAGARLGTGAWQARMEQLNAAVGKQESKDVWRLGLDSVADKPTLITWQPGASRLDLSPGKIELQGPVAGSTSLRWQAMQWSPTAWQSQGQVDALPVAWLEAITSKSLSDMGLHTDMLLSGQWQASKTDTLQASISFERSQGDFFLQNGDSAQASIAAGMQEARLQANLNEGQLSASLRWSSARAGKALLAFSTHVQGATGDWSWSDDVPVAGSVQLELPPMDAWSALAPPGWRLRGTVNTHIDLAGTLRQPQWSGILQARDLALRSVVDGIDFQQGQLDATLHDQQLDLQAFTLRGANSGKDKADGGQLRITGSVFWQDQSDAPSMSQHIRMALQAELQSLRLSTRPDRRLVASGKLSINFKDGALDLRGALTADHALFTLPDDSAPSLGDDVRVRQKNQATPVQAAAQAKPAATRLAVNVAVDLDPGPDFLVRGRGMDTRLEGKLKLTVNKSQPPRLTGAVRSVNGSYRAYGQKLDIERAVIRFTGPIDNPALDILAIRPKLTQRVGVQVSGTALAPIVSLYAEPDLPDAEKLAWLVLGRSASAGGAEAAVMQQAAMALFGGNGKGMSESMSSALGLDELSFSGGASGSAGAASITLGKRLSSDFYVAYEHSINSAVGVFSIFYDLSKRLTLRAQTGEQSAVDLVYTLRYD